MVIITPRYYARRKQKVANLLPWHKRNELVNYGYLTVSPYNGTSERFSISEWLRIEGDKLPHDDEYQRYSERHERVCWSHIRNPWEEEDEDGKWIVPQFNTIEEKIKYIDRMLDRIKCDRCGVMYPPFDGLPILWASNNGKVTLY